MSISSNKNRDSKLFKRERPQSIDNLEQNIFVGLTKKPRFQQRGNLSRVL